MDVVFSFYFFCKFTVLVFGRMFFCILFLWDWCLAFSGTHASAASFSALRLDGGWGFFRTDI